MSVDLNVGLSHFIDLATGGEEETIHHIWWGKSANDSTTGHQAQGKIIFFLTVFASSDPLSCLKPRPHIPLPHLSPSHIPPLARRLRGRLHSPYLSTPCAPAD